MKLRSLFKNEVIEFLCDEQDFGFISPPVPGSKMIPDWFKRIAPSVTDGARDNFGAVAMSAKKCLPLLDAMSLGFIIPLFADVNIRTNDEGTLIEASETTGGKVLDFHGANQLGGIKSPTGKAPAIKFINRWVIKTAPGYSTLFVPAINHIEPRFTCFSGVVDTDRYPKQVNFPAIWHAKGHDALLPAGTPLVTCIPFKRADMKRDVSIRPMTEKEAQVIKGIERKQSLRRHVYTAELREPRK